MADITKTCRVCSAELPLSDFRERMLRGVKIRIGTCRCCESNARKNGAKKLSPEEVRRVFDYDPDSGVIRWKPREDARKFHLAGQVAGTRRRDGRASR